MRREFRHLTYFNSVTIVFKCAEGREFRRSEVSAIIGSSDASQLHCNSVTIGAVEVIPDGNGYKTASFSKGAINTLKPPPLEAVDFADPLAHF